MAQPWSGRYDRITGRAYNSLLLEVRACWSQSHARLAGQRASGSSGIGKVGRRIESVVTPNGRRAEYDQQVLARLATDIDLRLRLLYEMVSLFRLFPVLPTTVRLGWSHYRMLVRVSSKRERTVYVDGADRVSCLERAGAGDAGECMRGCSSGLPALTPSWPLCPAGAYIPTRWWWMSPERPGWTWASVSAVVRRWWRWMR